MEDGGKTNRPVSRLSPLEAEVIQLFVQFSRALGQPRSIGEIYGLLFISPQPLTLDDLEARLQISRGSAFSGLQFLQELGAVREIKIKNSRRMHFEAVAELRNLAGSFLRQQISAHLGDSGTRLERIGEHAQSLTGETRKHAASRVKLLKSWDKNGRRVLPFLLKMLGGK
jgi:HTH-type transcriptional regulator, glycine betaine synthesis regulator